MDIIIILAVISLFFQYGIFILAAVIGTLEDVIESKRDLTLWLIPFGAIVLLIEKVIEFYKTLD